MMYDGSLERNRRLAWAKYFHVRRDLESLTLHAAELAEWYERTGAPQPPALADLITNVRAGVDDLDLRAIARFVSFHTVNVA